MNATSILLRRGNKLLIPQKRGTVSAAVVATFNQNLQSLGYTLNVQTLRALRKVDETTVTDLFSETIAVLKELRGVKSYRPMYPNFPQQVMDASWAELYLNAIFHYFSVWVSDVTGAPCIYLPKYRKEAREPLDEQVELTVIALGTKDDVLAIGHRLASANTSISATDKEDLKWLIEHQIFELPDRIPNKENLALVGSLLIGKDARITPLFKTATDILRLATAMSGGDVSLADNTKFKSFSFKERKALLGLMEHVHALEEDMVRWDKRWLRLGERLHPGTYAKRFPRTYAAFATLRSNLHINTFNSQVEAAVRSADIETSVELLSTRPGDFARRLDHVLRKTAPNNRIAVVKSFAEVAKGASTPVLLQVMTHFEHRNEQDMRIVFPKGNLARVRALPALETRFSAAVCDNVQAMCRETLIERFAHLPSLGKVYVDPQLRDCMVPFAQRSASKALHTLVRGSKIPFGQDEKNTVRFFIHWKNIKSGSDGGDWDDNDGRVDLDLSAMLFDENWKYMEHVTYYHLRSAQYKAVHSGDITSAPKGACEFIDLDIPSMVKHGARYVVQMVNVFTHQDFAAIPECFAGWMLREKPKSGEVFDPRTVAQRIDVAMAATAGMPMVLDVVERKVIWADIPVPTSSRYNYVHGQSETLTLLGKSMTQVHKPNLYDLFTMHAEARGKLVKKPESADVVFSIEAGTPYELDKIASEFMPNEVAAKAKV